MGFVDAQMDEQDRKSDAFSVILPHLRSFYGGNYRYYHRMKRIFRGSKNTLLGRTDQKRSLTLCFYAHLQMDIVTSVTIL